VSKNKKGHVEKWEKDRQAQWQPSASIAMLQRRAELLAAIRHYFHNEAVMEVETPVLSHAGNPDCYIDSFVTQTIIDGRAQTLYMQTSPEFFMKRLIAAGSGSIYQIAKAFRNNEAGRLHNPEFTMLEWYRLDYDYQDLMSDVEHLLKSIGMLDADGAIPRLTYAGLFEEHIGLNPHLCTRQNLLHELDEHDVATASAIDLSRNDCLSLLLTHVIEPALQSQPYLYIYDYPADQAALAVTRNKGEYAVAERFELYAHGIEVANGYTELTDSKIQAQRFDQELANRKARDLPSIKTDEHLIAALAAGMQACAGVAVGLDRLLIISEAESRLSEVLAFPIDRA
jgi:lysyl-tRNA synthetase class 2